MKQGLTSNQLKLIAILAMTIDHLVWALFPGYDTRWFVLLAHIVGRLTAPIMWFFLSEGYHHTRSVNQYARRLFSLAAVCLLTFPSDWSCVAAMGRLFYLYYPAHLFLLGLLRFL